MKNRTKTVLFKVSKIAIQIVIIASIILLACYVTNHITTKEQETEVVEEQKPEPLVVVIPEPNKMGTVTIITHDPDTGEEITTEIYGQIKILNNGRNGEQQQYILYTE